jgi:hypothetical protein
MVAAAAAVSMELISRVLEAQAAVVLVRILIPSQATAHQIQVAAYIQQHPEVFLEEMVAQE